jgi:hypothetical protein
MSVEQKDTVRSSSKDTKKIKRQKDKLKKKRKQVNVAEREAE